MDAMKYNDLRDFLTLLEQQGELKRITLPVDPHLEITEIADRTLRAGGPALLFENPKGYSMPVLCNLFGTPKRVAMGMGQEDVSALREVGKLLAFLKEPEPPKGFRDLFDKLPQFKQVLNMPTKRLRGAPCQQKIVSGDDVDLNRIPIMTCWPEDAAPLITWGLTVTRGPHKERQNLGIYRQQLIGKNKLIMRWLSHRGARWIIRSGVRRIRANVSRFLWRWVPIPPRFSVQSPPFRIHFQSMRLPDCCAVPRPKW